MDDFYMSKLAFSLVHESETGEGYKIEDNVSKSGNEFFLKNLNKETILNFLNMDETKVKVVVDKDGRARIFAHNIIANETIEIQGLGDHFISLLKMVNHAEKFLEGAKNGQKQPYLTREFIEGLNAQLLSVRYDCEEAAIGEYRYLTGTRGSDWLFDRVPYEVHHTMYDDEHNSTRSKSANIPSAANGNVIKQMEELTDWVNNEAFKEDILYDIAKFHARFVQIQPFGDGNKRTAKLLTDYLLLLHNMPLVDINEENRLEYLACVYYASAETEEDFANENYYYFRVYRDKVYREQGARTEENRYLPLKKFFEKNFIAESSKKVISDILRYDPGRNLHADQVSPEIN